MGLCVCYRPSFLRHITIIDYCVVGMHNLHDKEEINDIFTSLAAWKTHEMTFPSRKIAVIIVYP